MCSRYLNLYLSVAASAFGSVFVCMIVCRRLKRPLDEQLSFITASCQPLSLTPWLTLLLNLLLSPAPCPSAVWHGAVILSALHQFIDSLIFARPWTNACMPISLFSCPAFLLSAPSLPDLFLSSN